MVREKSIRLSKKHGLNPAVPVCFYCGQDKNQVLLPGRLPGDREAPRHAVWNMEPCETCQGYMQQGIILISVKEEYGGDSNPFRTGGWLVLKEEAIRQMVDAGLAEQVCESRWAFVPDNVWGILDLPRS